MHSAGPIFRGWAEDKEQKNAFLNAIFTKMKQPDDIIASNLDKMDIFSKSCDEGRSQCLCWITYTLWCLKIVNQISLEYILFTYIVIE